MSTRLLAAAVTAAILLLTTSVHAADKKVIHLTISDNGRGLVASEGDGIPNSLKRRARLLGAKVTAESVATGGTRISLKLPTRRWGRRK